jgi:hypothetical protein
VRTRLRQPGSLISRKIQGNLPNSSRPERPSSGVEPGGGRVRGGFGSGELLARAGHGDRSTRFPGALSIGGTGRSWSWVSKPPPGKTLACSWSSLWYGNARDPSGSMRAHGGGGCCRIATAASSAGGQADLRSLIPLPQETRSTSGFTSGHHPPPSVRSAPRPCAGGGRAPAARAA